MYDDGLDKLQVKTFNDEGMLCLEGYLDTKEVAKLLKEAKNILSDCDLSTHPRTQFKVDDNDHIGDAYFLNSSDNVLFFFDTDAFGDDGELKYPKEQAINKIGHALHKSNDVFKQTTVNQKVASLVQSLGYTDPRVLQSMCIFKQPTGEKNVERENAVPPHTDGTFLYTEPQSAIGFWFALEDCTIENGCLWYHPGSHKVYPITKRFVKVDGGKSGCAMQPVEHDAAGVPEDKLEHYKPVECKAGSLILIHNAVLHKSEPNRSNKSRYAYAFHVIDGTAKYDELNWLQVPASGGSEFTKLYSY